MILKKDFQNGGQLSGHCPSCGDISTVGQLRSGSWTMMSDGCENGQSGIWGEGFGPKWLNWFSLRQQHRFWDKPFSVFFFPVESQGQPLSSRISLPTAQGILSTEQGAGLWWQQKEKTIIKDISRTPILASLEYEASKGRKLQVCQTKKHPNGEETWKA